MKRNTIKVASSFNWPTNVGEVQPSSFGACQTSRLPWFCILHLSNFSLFPDDVCYFWLHLLAHYGILYYLHRENATGQAQWELLFHVACYLLFQCVEPHVFCLPCCVLCRESKAAAALLEMDRPSLPLCQAMGADTNPGYLNCLWVWVVFMFFWCQANNVFVHPWKTHKTASTFHDLKATRTAK